MSQKGRFKTKDLISGLWFFALGLSLSILSATKLSVLESAGPQEGFFPLIMGVIMAGLGMIVVFRSYTAEIHATDKVLKKERAGYADTLRLLVYLALIVLYAIVFESLGFLVSSALFLALVLKIIEKKGWRITLLVTIVAVSTSYFLFTFLLHIPLPQGLIHW